MPSLLMAGFQSLSSNSTANTCADAKIRGGDSKFAPCMGLFLLFFCPIVGAPVSSPKDAFLTRPRPFSCILHFVEQNCCRCEVRATCRPQPAQTTASLLRTRDCGNIVRII